MQMTPTGPSSQSFFFPNTDFFHYEANDNNYPKYDGFSGYPHEAKMYQSSTGKLDPLHNHFEARLI